MNFGNLLYSFIMYFLEMFVLTLGLLFVCGLVVHFCSFLFSKLLGDGAKPVYFITAAIGTPIHELGHAFMCLIFGHKIEDMKLWSPTAKDGMFGYVEHSYSKKNPWAVLGNLFIGLGPLFSGLGVIVLSLWLCLPTAWYGYLQTSHALLSSGASAAEVALGVFDLFKNIPAAFAENWWRALIGILIILPVSLHVKLSFLDIKGSMSAIPIYAGLLAIFSLLTFAINTQDFFINGMILLNVRLLSVFILIIAFAAVWVAIALLVFLLKKLIKCF